MRHLQGLSQNVTGWVAGLTDEAFALEWLKWGLGVCSAHSQ